MTATAALVAASDAQDALLRRLRAFILWVTVGLVAFGTVMVFSASTVLSYKNHDNAYSYGLRHAASVAAGGALLWWASRRRPSFWRKVTPVALIVTVALLIFAFTYGSVIGGQRNWIKVPGTTIQPSELAKLTMVLAMALVLATSQAKRQPWRRIWTPLLLVAGTVIGLVVIGGDFGTPLIMVAIAAVIVFVAGASLKPFAYVCGFGLLAGFVLVQSKGYRMDRLDAWFDPFNHPDSAGYQSIHGRFALGGGGLLGEGLGSGREKWGGLPAAHTDFILAAIGEETGVIGASLVVIALIGLTLAVYRLALLQSDFFARYACTGIAAWLGVQSVVNSAMVVGLAPVVGVTLPLISFGGSSMAATLAAIGVAMSFCRPKES